MHCFFDVRQVRSKDDWIIHSDLGGWHRGWLTAAYETVIENHINFEPSFPGYRHRFFDIRITRIQIDESMICVLVKCDRANVVLSASIFTDNRNTFHILSPSSHTVADTVEARECHTVEDLVWVDEWSPWPGYSWTSLPASTEHLCDEHMVIAIRIVWSTVCQYSRENLDKFVDRRAGVILRGQSQRQHSSRSIQRRAGIWFL